MNTKEITSDAIDTIIDRPVTITLDREPRGLWDKLFKPKKRTFNVRPLLNGNLMRIGKVVGNLPDQLSEDLTRDLLSVSSREAIVYSAAVCLQNNRSEPSKYVMELVKWQTDDDITRILQLCLSQLNLKAFISTIVLLKGSEILTETSPKDQEESIAPGIK